MIKFENCNPKSGYICEDCKNIDICRYADDMRKLEYELPKTVESMFCPAFFKEVMNTIIIEISCKRFVAKEAVR